MFRTRLLSGIVLVILALVLIMTGGSILLVALGAISIIGMYELFQIFQMEGKSIAFAAYAITVLYYLNLYFSFFKNGMVFVMAAMILLMTVYVFTYPKFTTEQVIAAFFGIFYVSIMLACVYLTRMQPDGKYIVWLIFLCSWGSDTCAYCVGVLFGKHKMSPKLSPKKSIEGAIGGIVGSMLLCGVFTAVFRVQLHVFTREILIYAMIGGIGAMISMVGDLAASAIKRNYSIKDYGKLIPGHGGILDRFDSMIFTAPVVYYLSFYLVRK